MERIDREIAEMTWQETYEMMVEMGFDFDAATKQHEIEQRELDQEVNELIATGESEEVF